MKTAGELGQRFDHHPPHHPVQVGLFTADSHYDHVGCLVRRCAPCGGQAMADVYAAVVESSPRAFVPDHGTDDNLRSGGETTLVRMCRMWDVRGARGPSAVDVERAIRLHVVYEEASPIHASEITQGVSRILPETDMRDFETVRDQGIGDEPAVTAPPQCLGAHDGLPHRSRACFEIVQRGPELLRFHVVGVGAERLVPPRVVTAVLVRFPAATERFTPPFIVHAGGRKGLSESVSGEVRVPPRAWEPPHVDEHLHTCSGENGDELFDRPGAVPHRQ